MYENINDDIDWNEQSLFTTPMGQVVQNLQVEMLLGKRDKTSEFSKYIYSLNDAITNISQSFWDIDLTIKLIKFAHPKIKSFKMTKVDRGDYLKYHFENYFFRLPKLKDQVLQLLNIVYQMGLGQSQGLEKKVRRHESVQNNKLYVFLDYLDEVLANIKPLRDTIAHRSDLQDSNFALLSTHQHFPIEKDMYEMMIRGKISYTYVFEKNQGILKQSIIILLLTLNEDFDKISKALLESPREE